MFLYELLNFAKHQINSQNIYIKPCDCLPSHFKLPAGFIINLSKAADPGTHWVALVIDSKRKGE